MSSNTIDKNKLYFCKKEILNCRALLQAKNDTGAGCIMTETVESKKFDVTDTSEKNDNADGEDHFGSLFEISHVNEGVAVGNEAEWMSIIDKFETPIKLAINWDIELPEGNLEVVLPMSHGTLRHTGLLIPENGVYKELRLYAGKKEENCSAK